MPEIKQITVEELIEASKSKPYNPGMPGNLRYQPQSGVPFFGFDNTIRYEIAVEFALWRVLAKLGVIPSESAALLTDELRENLCNEITTTLRELVEKSITKHDVRALVIIIQNILKRFFAESLAKWTHFSATSYDIIDTGRILAYKQAFWGMTFPALLKLISNIKGKILEFSGEIQIGRTHGQHALPITVDFWLATILNRIVDISEHLLMYESELKGKFSGAVGACNAQVALGLEEKAQGMFGRSFEELVMEELGLKPALISTQILPPEPLARFLHEHTLLSAALAQLARDCRILQKSEIREIFEGFDVKQVGSSTMAHKRNPIGMEGVEGIGIIVKDEYHKVEDVLISDNQRDGTGMSVAREFAGIVVLVQHQLETLNRVVPKISIDKKSLERNFNMNRHLILSEEVYLAMILYGYEGDAHEFVNHTLVPISQKSGKYLIEELVILSESNKELALVVQNMPSSLVQLLRSPEKVTGMATQKSIEVIERADLLLWSYEKLLKKQK